LKRLTLVGKASGVAALTALTWTGSSFAETMVVPPASTPDSTVTSAAQTSTTDPTVRPILGERTTYRAPNGPLLIGGTIVFLGSYVPAVIVAAAANTSFDNHLYIPLVGPWLDIANRPPCGNGVLEPSCSSQTGRKVLLGIDGVLQAAGAVSIVLGAVLTGRHTEIVTAKADPPKKPHVNVLPSQVGRDGYGVTAFGDF
jgi:hypothetical protein